MGVYRVRSSSVGRPFTKGNPGGGRPKGAQNKAILEIKEFARNFLMSDRYQRTLERRILAGTAPQTLARQDSDEAVFCLVTMTRLCLSQ
jgi:hypothetical protein